MSDTTCQLAMNHYHMNTTDHKNHNVGNLRPSISYVRGIHYFISYLSFYSVEMYCSISKSRGSWAVSTWRTSAQWADVPTTSFFFCSVISHIQNTQILHVQSTRVRRIHVRFTFDGWYALRIHVLQSRVPSANPVSFLSSLIREVHLFLQWSTTV